MRQNAALFIFLLIGLFILTPSVNAQTDPLSGTKGISMELEEIPIVTALNMIARQNQLNLVVSGQIDGTVTLRLSDVDIATALDAILLPSGYNYYINDGVIVVKSIEQAAAGERSSKILNLKYADPVIIQSALLPIKSTKGEIVILSKNTEEYASERKFSPTQLLIIDLPGNIYEMEKLVAELDKPERLISIHVRIIETKLTDKENLGFTWPTAITTSLGKSSTTDGSSDLTAEEDAFTRDLNNGISTWGTLSVAQAQAVLNLLEQTDNTKLISDPSIITVENHEATIESETVIPIATINRFTEGAATQDIQTFYDEKVGITLRVTPRINENGLITMDVHPKVEDIIGFSGPADNQKPITTSRSVNTRITVKSGETAVLGGLIKEDEIEVKRKVPILGHIPLLGGLLFTNKSTEKNKTDLIIMITPEILP